jgi:DNA-binding SARP family transcriptional activator
MTAPQTLDQPEPVAHASETAQDRPVLQQLLFEQLPTALLVTDESGNIVLVNETARAMLGPVLSRPHLKCCDILGCMQAGTPFARHCITRLALSRPRALPEVRVDLPAMGQETGSVWVIASELVGDERYAVLQLRPGVVGDRRRRTEPHWMGGPELRIITLGRMRLESGEGPLSGDWLGHRPGQLLKYLVCNRGRTVPLDEIIEVFWPDARSSRSTNVRQAIHLLRERLEPHRRKHQPSSFIAARNGGYELDGRSVWIDADEFEAGIRRGLDALAREDLPSAEHHLGAAVALHNGDFLADEPYADWALPERDRLADLAARGIQGLASIRLAEGDLDGAMGHLQRLAELQPLDLVVQQELLQLMLRAGKRVAAARRFELVRLRYKRAFGDEPNFTLADLA